MTIAMRPWRKSTWTVLVGLAGLVGLVWLAGGWGLVAPAAANGQESHARQGAVTVSRRDFVRGVRLSGTVEAIQSTTIAAPRLAGPNTQSLVITRLVRPGSTVQAGDLVVEFDRQQQLTNALDRRAELADLEQQIRKREAQERAAAAKDDSEIKVAQSSESRAELEMIKNPMIAKIEAEKNINALEQAKATLKQLQTTYELKRKAAEADIRMLSIRRDRAENAMKMAETNAVAHGDHGTHRRDGRPQDDLEIRADGRSPGGGRSPGRRAGRRHRQSERHARARARQPGGRQRSPSRAGATVGLDAYPELRFAGKIAQISPLGVISTLSPKVRTFIVLINVEGSHPNLMPDLTASLDVELARQPRALVDPAGLRPARRRARGGLQCSAARDSRSGRSRSATPTPMKSWSPRASTRAP